MDWERVEQVLGGLKEPWGVCAFRELSGHLLECRAKDRLPRLPASVFVFLFPYLTDAPQGNLSRYAAVADYHAVAGNRLNALCQKLSEEFPAREFSPFCDNSPIPEVRAASLCGLGAVGENGLLIHRKYGSWVFIGEIVTDLFLPIPAANPQSCLRCGLCVKICPGGALDGLTLRKDRCLSHITQKKGELLPEERALIRKNGCAWGCDVCQSCCPMNRTAAVEPLPEFSASAVPSVEKGRVGERQDRAYLWRGPRVVERNLEILEE